MNEPALHGALLVSCISDKDKKRSFLSALFDAQGEWAYAGSKQGVLDKLKVIARIGGMAEDKFDSCIADKELEDSLLADQLTASKVLRVASTPTIFISGEQVQGKKNYDTVSKHVDELLGADTPDNE